MGRNGWLFSGLLHVGIIMVAVLGLPSLFNNESDYIDATFAVDMVFEDDFIEAKKTSEDEIKNKVAVEKIEKKSHGPDIESGELEKIEPTLRSIEPKKINKPQPIKYKEQEKLSVPISEPIKQISKPLPVAQKKLKVASIPKPSIVKAPTEKKSLTVEKNITKHKPQLKPDQTHANFKSLLKSVVQEESKEEPEEVSKSEFVDLLSNIVETLPVTEERVVNRK